MYIQFTVSYDENEEKAVENAYKLWPISVMQGPLTTDIRRPQDFQEIAKMVKQDDIAKSMPCGPDIKKYTSEIEKALDLGFTHVYVNQVGHEQEKFIDFYKNKLIPKLQRKG